MIVFLHVVLFSESLAVTPRYDSENSLAYVGDSIGQISVIKVTAEVALKIDTMKRHTGMY